jgi:hypothetical protein
MLDRVVALATLAGGGFYLMQALALPLGSAARPGAAFFPVAVALFACVVGLVVTVRTFLRPAPARASAERDPEGPERRGRVLSAMVVLIAFCLVLPWIGYPAAAFAFVAILLRRLGSRLPGAVATAVLSAVVSYYVFAVLLDVPLPRGPW